jgi:PAS domain S-box-containing protein
MSPDIHRIAETLAASAAGALSVAVCAIDLEGTVAYWNRAAARIYGWPAEEALGRNLVELVPAPQSRERAAEILAGLASGEPWQGEFPVRARDGSLFDVFVVNLPLGDIAAGQGAIVGISAPAGKRRLVERNTGPLFAELRFRFG